MDQSQVFISALLHHVQKIVPLVKVTLIFFHQTGIFVLFGQKRTAKYSQTLPLLLGKSAVRLHLYLKLTNGLSVKGNRFQKALSIPAFSAFPNEAFLILQGKGSALALSGSLQKVADIVQTEKLTKQGKRSLFFLAVLRLLPNQSAENIIVNPVPSGAQKISQILLKRLVGAKEIHQLRRIE